MCFEGRIDGSSESDKGNGGGKGIYEHYAGDRVKWKVWLEFSWETK